MKQLISSTVVSFAIATYVNGMDNTFVLTIGSNTAQSASLQNLQYAVSDAANFGNVMSRFGRINPDQIWNISDPSIAQLKETLRTIRDAMTEQNREGQSTSKFVFFFSGHADHNGFHLKNGTIPRPQLLHSIQDIPATTKVAILDTCFSGFVNAKGVRNAASFTLPKADFDEPTGTIFLSATSANTYAYEDPQLKGGLFTHNLTRALSGLGDSNHDGVVTVDEAYQYTYRETKIHSLAYPIHQSQRPEFFSNLKGQGAITLTYPLRGTGRLVLDQALSGDMRLFAGNGVTSYALTDDAGAKDLVLPEGQYRIVISQRGRVGHGQIRVAQGEPTAVASGNLEWISSHTPEGKGLLLRGHIPRSIGSYVAISPNFQIASSQKDKTNLREYGLTYDADDWQGALRVQQYRARLHSDDAMASENGVGLSIHWLKTQQWQSSGWNLMVSTGPGVGVMRRSQQWQYPAGSDEHLVAYSPTAWLDAGARVTWPSFPVLIGLSLRGQFIAHRDRGDGSYTEFRTLPFLHGGYMF